MSRVMYYWPDIGQTAADAIEWPDDVRDDQTRAIATGICERNYLSDHDLWDGGERTVAVIRDGVESRWTVEAEEDVHFEAHKEHNVNVDG